MAKPKTPASLFDAVDAAVRDLSAGIMFSDATKALLTTFDANQRASFASVVSYKAITEPKIAAGLKQALKTMQSRAKETAE